MIFLSYTKSDRFVAQLLEAQLRGLGFAVWIDYRDLRIGTDIVTQLDRAIRLCQIFVALENSEGHSSHWMSLELSIARRYSKTISRLAVVKPDSTDLEDCLNNIVGAIAAWGSAQVAMAPESVRLT